MSENNCENNLWFLNSQALIVPMTVNVMCVGAHYVDSFLWDIGLSQPTPDSYSNAIVKELVNYS